jgi:hypothetical protein
MFDDMFGGSLYEKLDEETRMELAKLLQLQIEHGQLMAEVNKRSIGILMYPTPEAEQDLAEYSATVVAPVRDRYFEQRAILVERAIDLEAIKDLLPMIALGISQSINFPLLFTVLGFDPAMVTAALASFKEFFEEFMG